MAIITIQPHGTFRAAAVAAGDRFARPKPIEDASRRTPFGVVVGTAIVAGFLAGVFLYDGSSPFGTGAASEQPSLAISVAPNRDAAP